jgi:PAS domain S-box-containing protein
MMLHNEELSAEISESDARFAALEARLAEAEETLRAIHQGEVDALVVSSPDGDRIYTLEGADHPYRVLVEQMHQGTVTVDPAGLILYSNRQFASMLKLPVEDIVGARVAKFLAPDSEAIFAALVDSADAEHSQGELNLRTADGNTVPAYVSVNLLDASGVQTACVVVTDLTEQRRNEVIVKEEQLSRLILEQSAEAVIVIDDHGKIVRSGEAARKLAGHKLLFQDFDAALKIIDRNGRLDAARILAAARSGEGLRAVEAVCEVPGGRSCNLLVSAGPLWSANHELLGCVLSLTDITQLKQAEEALAKQAEELERNNAELRQFAYSASHDLQEPLRHIAIYSELLQNNYQGKLDPEADQILNQAVEAAHRMQGLVRDLLAYALATDAPREPARTDANVVLLKTLKTFEERIKNSGTRTIHGRLPVLNVHQVHLEQLFQNLIGNALKYRGEAAPEIEVAAEFKDGSWVLSVKDNGIGIDPKYHQQIFGLFRRLHGSGTYSGNGIGLAICQKIVQRYGGKIWVESEPGKGSTFRFTLPGEE